MADLRVAMAGTPDAANFGDLLFPLIAAHELKSRLGDIELVAYGYRDVAADDWPVAVRSVDALAKEISGFDLLLIGGGHLIRDDARLADGYRPRNLAIHQPLGLWLVPTLLAHAAGVPVVWSAVGVSEDFADWLAPMVRAAVRWCAYVAVRDEGSARALARVAPDAEIHVIPDTAFGADVLVDDNVRLEAQSVLASAGIGARPYVLMQSTPGLSVVRSAIEEALRTLRAREVEVLEVPIGPILGDRTGAFQVTGPVASLDRWPSPQVLTALLGSAEAIIHQSLHAGVVGFAAGVPCLRRPMRSAGKHDQLDFLPGVHRLGQNGASGALVSPRSSDAAADAIRSSIRGELHAYWDTVADLAGRSDQVPGDAMLELIAELPAMVQAGAGAIAAGERERTGQAEYEAAYRAFAHRTEELERELADTVDQAELAYLRRRDATLQRVLDGGWWKLRTRLKALGQLRLPR